MKSKLTEIKVSHLPTYLLAGADAQLLYPADVLGIGTGQLECLTGLTLQLANKHSMMTNSFYKHVLLKHIPNDIRPTRIKFSKDYFSSNGYGLNAVRISRALSQITTNLNPQYLTLLPWRSILDPSGHKLINNHLSWCPLCWKYDEEIGLLPYVRLSWTIQANTVCTHHKFALQNNCPYCGNLQPTLPQIPRPWICNKCGKNLHGKINKNFLKRGCNEREYWFSDAIEKLIERTCAQGITLDPGCLTNGLISIINTYSYGSYREFSRQVNFTERYLREWATNMRKPSFTPFLELCYRMDIPPDKLLLDDIQLTDPTGWKNSHPPKFVNMKKLSTDEKQKIKVYIDKIIKQNPLPPVTPSSIAENFGITYMVLSYNFPIQYKTLRSRLEQWRKHLNANSKRSKFMHLEKCVTYLIRRGIYPSERKLRDLKLMLSSDLRNPEIKRRLREFQKTYAE